MLSSQVLSDQPFERYFTTDEMIDTFGEGIVKKARRANKLFDSSEEDPKHRDWLEIPGKLVDLLKPRKRVPLVDPGEMIPVLFGHWNDEKNVNLVSVQRAHRSSIIGMCKPTP